VERSFHDCLSSGGLLQDVCAATVEEALARQQPGAEGEESESVSVTFELLTTHLRLIPRGLFFSNLRTLCNLPDSSFSSPVRHGIR